MTDKTIDRLTAEEPKMPKTDVEVQLSGEDGNAFSIIGRVSKALKRAGEAELAKEFTDKAFAAGSYDEILRLCMEYVDVG